LGENAVEVIIRLIGFFSAIAARYGRAYQRCRCGCRRSVQCAAARAAPNITMGRCPKSRFSSDSGQMFNTSSFESP
jgi:hypothetical protein